jgi:hypothetical protein
LFGAPQQRLRAKADLPEANVGRPKQPSPARFKLNGFAMNENGDISQNTDFGT